MRRNTGTILATAGAMLCFVHLSTGELLYQPATSTLSAYWTNAAGSLLNGIARVFDGLAAFERKDDELGRKHMTEAIRNLNQAAESYSDLESHLKEPRELRLDESSKRRAMNVLGQYRLELPSDERGAAELARTQVVLLRDSIERSIDGISKADLSAVQDLLATVTRVQRVGTEVALVMRAGFKDQPTK